jgi:type VI secretion system VasD/TssJ family lipoprotein
MKKTGVKSVVWAVALAGLGACSHVAPVILPPSPCTTPEPLRVSLVASQRLNPGENGESLATTVRLYQLKDTGRLIESTLDRILDGDRAVLGEDFLSVQEITLYPGEKSELAMIRGESATHFAVVAFFRRPSGPAWRAIRKLDPPNPQHCHGSVATPGGAAPSGLRFTLIESRVEMR